MKHSKAAFGSRLLPNLSPHQKNILSCESQLELTEETFFSPSVFTKWNNLIILLKVRLNSPQTRSEHLKVLDSKPVRARRSLIAFFWRVKTKNMLKSKLLLESSKLLLNLLHLSFQIIKNKSRVCGSKIKSYGGLTAVQEKKKLLFLKNVVWNIPFFYNLKIWSSLRKDTRTYSHFRSWNQII